MARMTRHKRTHKPSTRRKQGGTRHAKKARKAKPWIGRDGTYVKQRRTQKREKALHDHCSFCGSYGRMHSIEDAPIIWACLLGCGEESPRCVKCFPSENRPTGKALLSWDLWHLRASSFNDCNSFEAALARRIFARYGRWFGIVGGSSVGTPPWWARVNCRDIVVVAALAALETSTNDKVPADQRQLVSVVRRISKHQRVPYPEVRAALAAADLTDRVQPRTPRIYTNDDALFDEYPKEEHTTGARTATAVAYLLLKRVGNGEVRHGSTDARACAAYGAAAVDLVSRQTKIAIDELVVAAKLPRWTKGGKVNADAVAAAAAALSAGHEGLAKNIVRRETTGRRAKKTSRHPDNDTPPPRRRKKKRRRGPSAKGRKKG
jgi:hypothetical protein